MKKLGIIIMMFLLLSICACKNKQQTNEESVSPKVVSQEADKPTQEVSPTEEITPTVSVATPTLEDNPYVEDLLYLKSELSKKHVNPFTKISEEEFNSKIDRVIENADQLNDAEKQVAIEQIVASIGDAHTNTSYRDGYVYPLQFTMIDGDIYIINAVKELEDMIFTKVTKIDGVDMNTIIEQLTTLIAHENDSWITAMLPARLQNPFYLYGLDLIKDKTKATFTVEKDGVEQDYPVEAYYYTKKYHLKKSKIPDVLLGEYDEYYTYQYLPDSKAIYFQYNACMEQGESFQSFNDKMFDFIEKNKIDRIILDVRSNSGGNSEVLNPFTDKIAIYTKEHPEVKIFILIGRRTFSGGMFAIYRTMDAAPNALLVGESTGGALDFFAEIVSMDLPNSHLPIYYSTQYYEFTKAFNYQNKGIDTCEPDVIIQPTIEDYEQGKDPVLDYALNN